MNIKNKMGYKFLKCANPPQSYFKIKFSWNNPYLECFYLGIQVQSTDINYFFWTPANICDLGQQGDLYSKYYSGNIKVQKISKLLHGFKISPILADLCHILSRVVDTG